LHKNNKKLIGGFLGYQNLVFMYYFFYIFLCF